MSNKKDKRKRNISYYRFIIIIDLVLLDLEYYIDLLNLKKI